MFLSMRRERVVEAVELLKGLVAVVSKVKERTHAKKRKIARSDQIFERAQRCRLGGEGCEAELQICAPGLRTIDLYCSS